MEKSVFCQARDLSPEKRHAAEILLGKLGEDELVLVRSSKGQILKAGLTGEALTEAYQHFFERADATAQKANGASQSEIDAVIDEACDFVRHNRG